MLSVNDNWKKKAAAGTISPRLIVELKPTVLYAEECQGGGVWPGTGGDFDLDHPTGELMLGKKVAEHSEGQATSKHLAFSTGENYDLSRSELAEGWDTYEQVGQFFQTFKVDNAFKVEKFWIGLQNEYRDEYGYHFRYSGKVLIRLFANLEEPGTPSFQEKTIEGIYGDRAEVIFSAEIDCSGDRMQQLMKDGSKVDVPTKPSGTNIFIEIDCSQEAVWIPGSGTVCSIDLTASEQGASSCLKLYGNSDGGAYTDGQLFEHNHQTGDSYVRTADLGFKFWADGFKGAADFANDGETEIELDLGEDPASNLTGELEICYCAPGDSTITFEMKEKPDGGAWGDWSAADDGAALNNKRYVLVKVIMLPSTDRSKSPKVFSIRVAYKRSDSFVWGPDKIDGFPNLVSSAPTYSAEGDPITGALQFADTSEITLLDPSGLISSQIFGQYHVKNDQIIIKLGFKDLAASDFIAIKSLWIEDWSPGEGTVTIQCYDKQRRYRNAEIPSVHGEDPALPEQIHFNKVLPGAIKKELLRRAGERPSKIDTTSFSALDTAFAWELNCVIDKARKPQEICRDLNQHLLSFEHVDEGGTWKTPYVDFSASPVATIAAAEVILNSESFSPGWTGVRNAFAVFYGGKGKDEKQYREICLLLDTTSAEQFKEIAVDKLFSEFIPVSDDKGNPDKIASMITERRCTILRDGFREITFATRLDRAGLQLGDHIYFYSTKYQRPGSTTPNPLFCFITRKQINHDLATINWRALILFDNEQTPEEVTAINQPQNFAVVDNGDRTATWTWDKATGDDATILRYLLYRRHHIHNNWGSPVAEVDATGADDYEYTDNYRNCMIYDFGIRAVHSNGRVSQIVTQDDLAITDSTLAAPTWTLVPVISGWEFYITADVASAIKYYVYKYTGIALGWERIGEIAAPAIRKRKAGYGGHYNHRIEKLYGVEYGRFKLSTLNGVAEGTLSAEQADWSLPYQGTKLAADMTPSLPAEAGTYPTLTLIQNDSGEFKYSVKLKIEAPSGYEDLVARYEIQRRDNGSGSYGAWELVGEKKIDKYPAPHVIYWINQDVQLKPGVSYQWQVRVRAQDGTPSDWTDSLTKEVAGDSTAPAKPTVAVVALPLGNLLTIVGGTEADFAYFKIEGSDDAGENWSTLVEKQALTVWIHGLTTAGIDVTWRYRVTAYDRSGNASTVSDESTDYGATKIVTDVVVANTFVAGDMAFTVAGTTNIIGMINASSEGGGTLNIAAAKIAISGSCTFSSGYNPTAKLDHTGGAYNSAGSGARVRIFPDANTGILAIDNASNEVLRVNVGGTDVGDVIIGDIAGQHLKWDKSADILNLQGVFSSIGDTYKSTLTAGSVTCDYYNGSTWDDRIKMAASVADAFLQMYSGVGEGTIFLGINKSYLKHFDGYVEAKTSFKVNGTQVVGARKAAVAAAGDLTGVQATAGSDTINMANLNYLLGVMYTELSAWQTTINDTIARLKTTGGHGLIADS